MHVAGHRARTTSLVRVAQAFAGVRGRKPAFKVGRVPPPAQPLALEAEYARKILQLVRGVLDPLREPLLRELGQTLERTDSYFTTGQLESTPEEFVELVARANAVYAKRRRQVYGLTVWVENEAGTYRQWIDSDGTAGVTLMAADYGHLDKVIGADGEEVDVYLGPLPPGLEPEHVYVVHQMSKASGFAEYDEDKVMLGYVSEEDARAAYLAHYDDPRFLGSVTALTFAEFKSRLERVELGTVDTVRLDAADASRLSLLIARARKEMEKKLNATGLEHLARDYARATSDHQREQLRRQTKESLTIDIAANDVAVPRMMDKFVKRNVERITSLGNDSLDDLERLVVDAVKSGRRADAVAKDIEERYGVTERKARLIARNEIGTLNAQVTAARQKELGVTRFTWRTVSDERVREKHAAVDGQVFYYDDPPPVGVYDDPVLPGEDINCRCYAEPVFEDIFDDPEGAAEAAASARAENLEEGDDGEDEGEDATSGPADDEGLMFEVAQRPDESAAAYAARLARNEASRLSKARARAAKAGLPPPPAPAPAPPLAPGPTSILPAHTPPTAAPARQTNVTSIAAPAPQPIAATATTAKAVKMKPGETPAQYAARMARNEASRKAKALKRAAAKGGTVPAAKPVTAPPPPPTNVTPIAAPQPQPITTLAPPAPAPAATKPPLPMKPGETQAQYAARLARNEASRLSKAAKRAAAKGQPVPPASPPAAPESPARAKATPEPAPTASKPRGPGPTGGSAPRLPPEPDLNLSKKDLARLPTTDELEKMSRAELIARGKHWRSTRSRQPGEEIDDSGRIKSTWDMTSDERERHRQLLDAADRAKVERDREIAKAPIEFIPIPREIPRLSQADAKKLESIAPLASAGKLNAKQQKAAREYLRSTIDQYHLSLRDPTDNAGASLKVKKNYRARGTHDNFGGIIISKEVAENAGRFAQDIKNGVDYRTPFEEKRKRGYLLDREEVRKLDELGTRANDYRTFVHEQIHGYGPRDVQSRSYAGTGVLIEEVTTETVARKIVREQIGLQHGDVEALSRPTHAGSYGSYNREIVTASDAIAAAVKDSIGYEMTSSQAYEVLERTALKYKSLDVHPLADTPDGSVTLFSRSVDHDEIERHFGGKLTSDERAKIEAAIERELEGKNKRKGYR